LYTPVVFLHQFRPNFEHGFLELHVKPLPQLQLPPAGLGVGALVGRGDGALVALLRRRGVVGALVVLGARRRVVGALVDLGARRRVVGALVARRRVGGTAGVPELPLKAVCEQRLKLDLSVSHTSRFRYFVLNWYCPFSLPSP